MTLVYCDQTAGSIKQGCIRLGPGHTVLDGDPAPPKRGTAPNFPPMSVVTKRLGGLRCHLVWRYRSRPRRHYVRWGSSSLPPKKAHPPNFGPMFVVAKRSPILATAEQLLDLFRQVSLTIPCGKLSWQSVSFLHNDIYTVRRVYIG